MCQRCWTERSTHSSILLRFLQEVRWSRALSVMRGQLSSSSTVSFVLAELAWPRCLMPSSVISSQWERERELRAGQREERLTRVESVIRAHSSRSIRVSEEQFLASAWKPVSVRCVSPAHSRVTSSLQLFPRLTRAASVRLVQFEMQRYRRLGLASVSSRIPSSCTLRQPCRLTICRPRHFRTSWYRASSPMWRQPLAMKVFRLWQPSARAATPAAVIISHQEMLRLASWNRLSVMKTTFAGLTMGQPLPRARRLLSVMLLQEEMSTCLSLLQCLARLWEVWSVRREQEPRSSWSMLGQFLANMRRAWSPTAWTCNYVKYPSSLFSLVISLNIKNFPQNFTVGLSNFYN